MKEVKAIVKPFKANDVLSQLLEAGFNNLTVTMAEGTGNFSSVDSSLSMRFSITDSEVAVIIVVCNDSEVEKIVSIISENGRTGNPGDGLIYVSDLHKVFRVKTGLEI